jgi:cyclopropane fatty-acyl-phospholipid synthase-like methyltransferase
MATASGLHLSHAIDSSAISRAAAQPEPVKSDDYITHASTVVDCYSLFDKFFPACGLLDYTEGIYTTPTTTYEEAQQNQINYVLDQVNCGPGVRLLEVGCGNGNLLAEAQRRGAAAVGVTISPEQVRLCRNRGLDVRCQDYKLLDAEYFGKFDAVVANGPIEHFVQPQEAAAGKTDAIYRQMFDVFHKALDPRSRLRKMINTTIHFLREPDPRALLISPWRHKRGSDNWHWAWLARSFGGYYPTLGQFERCATGRFQLAETMDGTRDYCLTSEEWLRRIRRVLPTWKGMKILASSLPNAWRNPRQTFDMLACMLGSESWNWQFREPSPPTCLLRQTWKAA